MTDIGSPQMGKFNTVDATGEAERFVAFLEWIENLPQSTDLRKGSYSLLNIQPGHVLIDVSCGTGKSVFELSEKNTTAIGIDSSEKMISVAQHRFPNCDFRIAKAESLPFEDNTIDGYRAERLFQHLENATLALTEAYRVLKPGGHIVLLDQDYDMWAIDAGDMALTRDIMKAHSDSIINRWIGRKYHNLLLDSGFADILVKVQTLVYTKYSQIAPILPSIINVAAESGTITTSQADKWLDEQKHRGETGRFFIAMPIFIASAIRP